MPIRKLKANLCYTKGLIRKIESIEKLRRERKCLTIDELLHSLESEAGQLEWEIHRQEPRTKDTTTDTTDTTKDTNDSEITRGPKMTNAKSRGPEWRELTNGAVAHKDATISSDCKIKGPAVFRGGIHSGGIYYGGTFHGGIFHGGTYHDGIFHDGSFHGGTYHYGAFYDGTFRGGTYRGGIFYRGHYAGGEFVDGWFLDGVYLGGRFYSGTYLTGRYLDGNFYKSVAIVGILPWTVNIASPTHVSVGCYTYTLADWEEALELLAHNAGVEELVPLGRRVLELIKNIPRSDWPE